VSGPIVVAEDIVAAALHVAEETGQDAADVPLLAIAAAAGMSRSTLIRRLGGTRRALDDAIRASGVDPGGRTPVRDRAVQAAAELISSCGLAAVTLEAIAARANCSVHSLYAVFGARTALLQAVYDRYVPMIDLEALTIDSAADLRSTVGKIYRVVAESLSQEPRVVPAMMAEALAGPATDSSQTLFSHAAPKILAALGPWLAAEVAAGRIRDLPLLVLLQQMIAPIAMHTMLRPALGAVSQIDLPELTDCTEMFADTFVRAVAVEPISTKTTRKGKQS
jgi:AcrR family transcriptional regulator